MCKKKIALDKIVKLAADDALSEPTGAPARDLGAPCRNQQAILILGMHRSGTSVLTRVINLLGVDLADHLMTPNWDNEAGYWESFELAQIHDDLFALLGSSWDDLLPIDESWLASLIGNDYKAILGAYLLKQFSYSPCFAIKDPRMCRFIPLWLDVLKTLKVQVKVVIPYRHPVEVAKSLEKRDLFLWEKTFLVWLRHILAAEFHTRGLKRCFVNYSDLLQEPGQTMARISKQCAIAWPNSSPEVMAAALAAIEPTYYHQRMPATDAVFAGFSELIPRAYRAVGKLRLRSDNKQALAQLDAISECLCQADKLYQAIIIDKNNDIQYLFDAYNSDGEPSE
ncbi:sulfotransferase family protein [Methylovulum psychrotolerans]|uniref:Sulfotransferase family protein n=1 Tax=Methylovulum psychrotolerans TaxID=1704499 RepID=A0A2S5CP42_9GAMM|nr:hypothetical protein [Methylovulum psychrotolerans]POZ52589.1 hypothetical protein AADEFJLK_01191 [Methylovulum psychrotolerans]